MTDLISRKALLEAIKEMLDNFKTSSDGFGFISTDYINLITNAPAIEQGEPVALVYRNLSGQIILVKPDFGYFDISQYIGAKFYTTPPQPQTRLSQEEINRLMQENTRFYIGGGDCGELSIVDFANAIMD